MQERASMLDMPSALAIIVAMLGCGVAICALLRTLDTDYNKRQDMDMVYKHINKTVDTIRERELKALEAALNDMERRMLRQMHDRIVKEQNDIMEWLKNPPQE